MQGHTTNVSIISVHQFDFDWIKVLVDQLRQHGTLECNELIIVNNDRTPESHAQLNTVAPEARIATFPPDHAEVQWRGHDHGSALDQAIATAKLEVITIFDSDAHPIEPSWLGKSLGLLSKHDLVGAQDPSFNEPICHPCFMMFRRSTIQGLTFRDFERDVGRNISFRLRERGASIFTLSYSKIWPDQGFIYADMIYHHGKGSWYNQRNRAHVSEWFVEKSLARKSKIMAGKYSRHPIERARRLLNRTKKHILSR